MRGFRYVQQPICSPSRNSFLSGRYPEKTGVWNFINSFREGDGTSWTALYVTAPFSVQY